jgi:uncharacterized membrane protein YhaH (DUF805 family)
MIDWYKKVVFENYANFKGRARRSEYWYFILCNLLITIVLAILDGILGLKIGNSSSGVLGTIYGLAVFIPGLAVAVRRLHDIGKSGWLLLIFYIAMAIAAGIMIFSVMSVILGGGDMASIIGTLGVGFFGPLLVVLVLAIWLIVLYCIEGNQGANKYGPDPKQIGEDINEIGMKDY